MILEQENYTRNKTFSVIKLHIVLKELVNHTLLLTSSLKILPMERRGDANILKKRMRSKIYLDYEVSLFRSCDSLQVQQTCFLFCKHISHPTTSGYCSTILPSGTLLPSTLSLNEDYLLL